MSGNLIQVHPHSPEPSAFLCLRTECAECTEYSQPETKINLKTEEKETEIQQRKIKKGYLFPGRRFRSAIARISLESRIYLIEPIRETISHRSYFFGTVRKTFRISFARRCRKNLVVPVLGRFFCLEIIISANETFSNLFLSNKSVNDQDHERKTKHK